MNHSPVSLACHIRQSEQVWLSVAEDRVKAPLSAIVSEITHVLASGNAPTKSANGYIAAFNATGFIAVHTGYLDLAERVCRAELTLCLQRYRETKDAVWLGGFIQALINSGRLESRKGNAQSALEAFSSVCTFLQESGELHYKDETLAPSDASALKQVEPGIRNLGGVVLMTDGMRACIRSSEQQVHGPFLDKVERASAAEPTLAVLRHELYTVVRAREGEYKHALRHAEAAWVGLGERKSMYPQVACLIYDVYEAAGAREAAKTTMGRLLSYHSDYVKSVSNVRACLRLTYSLLLRLMADGQYALAAEMLQAAMPLARTCEDYAGYLRLSCFFWEINQAITLDKRDPSPQDPTLVSTSQYAAERKHALHLLATYPVLSASGAARREVGDAPAWHTEPVNVPAFVNEVLNRLQFANV